MIMLNYKCFGLHISADRKFFILRAAPHGSICSKDHWKCRLDLFCFTRTRNVTSGRNINHAQHVRYTIKVHLNQI